MADYDYLIRGGTIVDGLRSPRYVSDLVVKDGKIAKIGGATLILGRWDRFTRWSEE